MTDPGKAVMFPTTWAPIERISREELLRRFPLARGDRPSFTMVVKMTWRKGRFQVTYADGATYTEVDGHRK